MIFFLEMEHLWYILGVIIVWFAITVTKFITCKKTWKFMSQAWVKLLVYELFTCFFNDLNLLNGYKLECISISLFWKIILHIWKTFQNTEEWCLPFWNIFFHFNRHVCIMQSSKMITSLVVQLKHNQCNVINQSHLGLA